MSHQRRPIIVFGMDRSGTSVVANLVSCWGAYGGETEQMERGNDFNPKGFFENQGLQQLMADLLNSIDVGYWDPSFAGILEQRAADPAWSGRAVQLIDRMARSGRPWFWKEPILSVTLPFWQPFLENCVYVVPVRNPYDSAVSYERFQLTPSLREQMTVRSVNLLRWQYFLRCCLEVVESAERKIFIPYEELTADPQPQCRRLADFLDASYGTDGLPPDRLQRMEAAIEPKLRRNRSEVPFDEREDVTPEQKALYRFLQAKVDDPALPYEPGRYPMYAGWREYLQSFTVLSNVYLELEPSFKSPLVLSAYYADQGLRWLAAQPRRWWGRNRD